MREEKFSCPDVDCGYTNFEGGECPQCGVALEKIKGDDYLPMVDEIDGDEKAGPMVSEFSDDPDEISWYSDGESYSTL